MRRATNETRRSPQAIGGAVLRHDHLEHLRLLVRRAVVATGREERRVTIEAEVLHELWHELVGGQAAEPPVLGRDDHVEAAVGRGDDALLLESAQRGARRDHRRPDVRGHRVRREVVLSSGRQVGSSMRSAAGMGRTSPGITPER